METSHDGHDCVSELLTFAAHCAQCAARWLVQRDYRDADGALVGLICTWRYPTCGRSFIEWSDGIVEERTVRG